MTVLMRQAGLAVPGIYVPSREESQQFGQAKAHLFIKMSQL
jgi:hypothetical protein